MSGWPVQKFDSGRFADAVAQIDLLLPGRVWLFGKGRSRPEEPLFGLNVYEPDDVDHPLVEVEGEDPVECVMQAVRQLAGGAN